PQRLGSQRPGRGGRAPAAEAPEAGVTMAGGAVPGPPWLLLWPLSHSLASRGTRDHGAVPRPRRSAEDSAETTVERRGHCACTVVPALHRCFEALQCAHAPA